MNTTIIRADELEARFERLLVDFGYLQQQVAGLINQLQGLQVGNQQPGGSSSGITYAIAPTVIAAATGTFPSETPGSVASQTIYALVGGAETALPGTSTVYNRMAAATVATSGKTIMVGANPDGTYSVITQSC